MDIKLAFAIALKMVRKVRGLTQEDFSDTSSRTYISTLERGKKSITLEKLDQLASTLQIQPLTLLTLTYAHLETNADTVAAKVVYELQLIERAFEPKEPTLVMRIKE